MFGKYRPPPAKVDFNLWEFKDVEVYENKGAFGYGVTFAFGSSVLMGAFNSFLLFDFYTNNVGPSGLLAGASFTCAIILMAALKFYCAYNVAKLCIVNKGKNIKITTMTPWRKHKEVLIPTDHIYGMEVSKVSSSFRFKVKGGTSFGIYTMDKKGEILNEEALYSVLKLKL